MSEKGTIEKAAKVQGGWESWCAEDRLDAIGWAGVFIWGALVLLAEITNFSENFSWWDGWGVFFVGVAAIVLVGTAIRWFVPEFRREGLALGLVFGLILLGIGLGDLAVWIWPVLLGGIGVAILYSVVTGRK
jgi:hypothetical protein